MSTLGLTLTFGWAMLRYATSTFARAGRAAGGGGAVPANYTYLISR
jgi:hypothetical protein